MASIRTAFERVLAHLLKLKQVCSKSFEQMSIKVQNPISINRIMPKTAK